MSYLQQINKIASQFPLSVLQDINQRVGDWLTCGGNENDEYIGQQLRYAENVLKRAASKS